jgi:hypothetical protein
MMILWFYLHEIMFKIENDIQIWSISSTITKTRRVNIFKFHLPNK